MSNSSLLNQEVFKDFNKRKILGLLMKYRELTKQRVSSETGLSITTVISNINELIEEGLIEESGVGDSTGGRKPVKVKFLPDSRYSFGVELTHHYVRIIMANLYSEIRLVNSFPIFGFKNMEDIIIKIKKNIDDSIEINQISRNKILGIGFSLPGTVNEDSYMLESAPNISMKNVNFSKFSDLLEYPLYIENEANLAAFSELNLGIAKEMRNLVYISVNEGIGTGIVINDTLYKGKNKRAGEFGHMIIVADGKRCNCGRNGCFEQYASINALLEEYNYNSMCKVENLHDFFSKIDEIDLKAIEILDKYLSYLAMGIQNIILVIDPHYIVLGGQISDYSDFYIDRLKEKVFVENDFYSSNDVKLLVSKLKENASILGAALLPVQKNFVLAKK